MLENELDFKLKNVLPLAKMYFAMFSCFKQVSEISWNQLKFLHKALDVTVRPLLLQRNKTRMFNFLTNYCIAIMIYYRLSIIFVFLGRVNLKHDMELLS